MNGSRSLAIASFQEYPHPCSYFPERAAWTQFILSNRLPPAAYEALLHEGFRRSGRMIYRPVCERCADCQSLRVLVAEFRPNRAMRRTWQANQDLDVCVVQRPELSDEKQQLYHRYLSVRHEREQAEGLEEFLYDSPVLTCEIEFRAAGKLVSVAIADVLPSGLSAVYCYFDPDQPARGLGTYAILWEIDYCRREALPHLYLGYYIRDCRKMSYKNRFSPHEILGGNGKWHRAD